MMVLFYIRSTIRRHWETQRKLINSKNDKKSFGVNIEIWDDLMKTDLDVITNLAAALIPVRPGKASGRELIWNVIWCIFTFIYLVYIFRWTAVGSLIFNENSKQLRWWHWFNILRPWSWRPWCIWVDGSIIVKVLLNRVPAIYSKECYHTVGRFGLIWTNFAAVKRIIDQLKLGFTN